MHSTAYNRKDHLKKNLRMMRNHWQMYLIVLLPLVHIFIFKYLPIYGIQIAFKKWNPILGITGSQWVGLKLFGQFFSSPDAPRIIWNTLRISLIDLFIGFPMPIILALAVNACGAQKFRKTVQMMQNTMNMGSSEIISTYVYKVGLKQSNYGFSAAISLLNTIVSLVMVTSTNFISKRLTETSLW